MLELLSEEDRQIIVLHAVSGMKHREIAQIMHLPVSTVLSKYRRSLQKLRTALEEP
jgi:RNA polymerase sigma-70 factor (ECF subfamily)